MQKQVQAVIITIVLFLIVLEGFLPVIIIMTSCCGPAELSVLMHGICGGHEIVETVGTNEAQVIMHHLQLVYHCPFILAFFPTPWASG